MKLTLNLEGVAADQMLEVLLYNYAMLVLKSKLDRPGVTLRAPWMLQPYKKRGRTELMAYAAFIKEMDKARLNYKRALAEHFNEVPEPPEMILKPAMGYPDKVVFNPEEAKGIARRWAQTIQHPVAVARAAHGLKP